MSRLLIDVPQKSTKVTYARAVQVSFQSGSFLLTQADLGCKEGKHKARIVMEIDS
jgi:hypothetical protein